MALADMLAALLPGSEEEGLVRRIDFSRLPRHVAIIMDGNGRWAASRHLPRVEGHRAGIESVRTTVESSARLGISVLTLYAFSVENWKRPDSEVTALMGLLRHYLRLELKTLLRNNIRFHVIGQRDRLGPEIREELQSAEANTAGNTGMIFNIALSYGGRAEIVDAARRAIRAGIGADDLADLLIRTSGEMRVSNFLLWQIAYAEIWVTEALWPDFRTRHLLEALVDYQKRNRRYGAIPSPTVGAGKG